MASGAWSVLPDRSSLLPERRRRSHRPPSFERKARVTFAHERGALVVDAAVVNGDPLPHLCCAQVYNPTCLLARPRP